MCLLRIMEKHLSIGSEGWKSVMHDQEIEFPHQGRTAPMREHSTLHKKQMPTSDPDCPKDVKLAKQTKHMIGNKAAVGDAEEEINPEVEQTQVLNLLPTVQNFQKPPKHRHPVFHH